MIPEVGVQAPGVHRRGDDSGQTRGVADSIKVQQTAENVGKLHRCIFLGNACGGGNHGGGADLVALVDVLPERDKFGIPVFQQVVVVYLRNHFGVDLALGTAVQIQVLPIIRGVPH